MSLLLRTYSAKGSIILSPLCAVSAHVPLVYSPKETIYCPSRQKKQNKKDNLLSPSQNVSRQIRRILSRYVHLPFLPQTHTPRHRITFSQRLSFSIRDPDINGTYPENACGMVLLFQSIIVYGEQLNERMCESNEQNLSNAKICHNKDI